MILFLSIITIITKYYFSEKNVFEKFSGLNQMKQNNVEKFSSEHGKAIGPINKSGSRVPFFKFQKFNCTLLTIV